MAFLAGDGASYMTATTIFSPTGDDAGEPRALMTGVAIGAETEATALSGERAFLGRDGAVGASEGCGGRVAAVCAIGAVSSTGAVLVASPAMAVTRCKNFVPSANLSGCNLTKANLAGVNLTARTSPRPT